VRARYRARHLSTPPAAHAAAPEDIAIAATRYDIVPMLALPSAQKITRPPARYAPKCHIRVLIVRTPCLATLPARRKTLAAPRNSQRQVVCDAIWRQPLAMPRHALTPSTSEAPRSPSPKLRSQTPTCFAASSRLVTHMRLPCFRLPTLRLLRLSGFRRSSLYIHFARDATFAIYLNPVVG